MTFRNIDRRIKKLAQNKIKTYSFLLSKSLCRKKVPSYWKNFAPNSTEGYPLVDKVWEIVFVKLTNINKIRYSDLYQFYFTCFIYHLHFSHRTYKLNPTKIEALKEHDKYVSYLYDQEKKRQDTMDSKAKQIITNTSTVITIIGLFITILASFFKGKIDIQNSDFYILISSLTFLFVSLLISVNVLNLKKYGRPFPEIVFKEESRNEEDFLRNKIISFHYPIILNTSVNSKKSIKLIWANYVYILALICVLWLALKNLYILTQNKDFDAIPVEKITPIPINVNINFNAKSTDSITKIISKSKSDKTNAIIENKVTP